MQTIRVAAVSMNGFLGEPEKVLSAIAGWAEKAKAEGAELVVFPELVVHGHCTPNTWDLAEAVPDGPAVRRIEQIAAEGGVTMSVGLSEKQQDIVYNTQVLITPDGYVGKQQKIHLSRDEVLYYKGGSEMPVFDIGPCRVGSVICYDNLLPEVPRLIALGGADIIIAPHAARMAMWDDTKASQQAARQASYDNYQRTKLRAAENACFYVIADQAGRAGYVDMYPKDSPNQPHHAGGAFIFDPIGETLAQTQVDEIRDEMIVATLEPSKLAAARSQPNYTLRTRRPELFGGLVER